MGRNTSKYVPDVLTDTNVIDPNFFKADLESLYEDADKIETLATRIDTDLDEMYFAVKIKGRETKEPPYFARGTLGFVSEQMKTLASLRVAKNNALHQAMSAKLKIAQFAVNKKKIDEANADISTIAREFQKLFLQHKDVISDTKQFETIANNADNHKSEELLLDKRINDLEKKGSINFTDGEKAIKYEKEGVIFKVHAGPSPYFVAVSRNSGKIIPEYPKSLLPNKNIISQGVLINNQFHCGDTVFDMYDER